VLQAAVTLKSRAIIKMCPVFFINKEADYDE